MYPYIWPRTLQGLTASQFTEGIWFRTVCLFLNLNCQLVKQNEVFTIQLWTDLYQMWNENVDSCLERKHYGGWCSCLSPRARTVSDGIVSASAGRYVTTDCLNRNTQAICLFVLEWQSTRNAFPQEKFLKGVKSNHLILAKEWFIFTLNSGGSSLIPQCHRILPHGRAVKCRVDGFSFYFLLNKCISKVLITA